MRVTCDQTTLSHGVQVVSRAVAARHTLPILGGILLNVTGDEMQLSTTDLEIGIKCRLPVTASGEGSVVLPARLFSEIVRRMPGEKVDLLFDGAHDLVTLRCQDVEFSLNGQPAADFPILPEASGGISLILSGNNLRTLIRHTSFALADDDARPVLTGGFFFSEGPQATMVATDGVRLAIRRCLSDHGDSGNQGANIEPVILPGKTLNELNRVLPDEDPVMVGLMQNQILFSWHKITVVSRLIEGQFPKYEQFIPTQFSSSIKVDTKRFTEAVERASLLQDGPASIVKFDLGGGELKLSSSAPEVGKVEERMAVESEGDPIQIAFSCRYLLDVLKAVEETRLWMRFTGPFSPSLVQPIAGEDFRCLILPVRFV
ncbi:MAG: DNA polymerase III subunit beta [Chloroflexi bacterium]|nr:DNA polymerase III subunit beta [Chloroflexota bacterium]